jgi:hypothetical protein
MENNIILVCHHCGSEDVLSPTWFNPNTKEIDNDVGLDHLDDYCNNCKDMTSLVEKEDFDYNIN